METNLLEIAKETVAHTGPPSLLGVMVERSPMGLFVVAANFLVSIAVACIALVNAMTLFRRGLTPNDVRTAGSRIAISRYMILFLAAVWLFCMASSLQSMGWHLAACASDQMGEAQTAVLYFNMQPPVSVAWVLVALTGLHVAVGIGFVLRRKVIEDQAQHPPAN